MNKVQAILSEIIGSPPARGRKPASIHATVTRELEDADVQKLHDMNFGDLGSRASPLKKLKHSHHNLARLVADGVREEEISAVTGYSSSYISSIKHDPAFLQLVAYYTEQKGQVYLDVHQRLSTLSLDAVDELQSRMAEQPEVFQNRELKEIAEMGLDRVGFGKATRVDHNHTVALVDPAQIARMKSDLRSRSNVAPLITADYTSSDQGSEIRGAGNESTLAPPQGPAERKGTGPHLPDESSESPQEDGGVS
jgi:hypothetical protein